MGKLLKPFNFKYYLIAINKKLSNSLCPIPVLQQKSTYFAEGVRFSTISSNKNYYGLRFTFP